MVGQFIGDPGSASSRHTFGSRGADQAQTQQRGDRQGYASSFGGQAIDSYTGGDRQGYSSSPGGGGSSGGRGLPWASGGGYLIARNTGDGSGLYGLPGQDPSVGPANAGQLLNSTVNSYYGPQSQIMADQFADLKAQLQDPVFGIGAQAAQATGSAYAQYNNSMAGIGLDREGIGIGQGLNKTQQANLAKLRGILSKQYGIQGEQLANQLGGLKINETDLRDQSGRKQWDLRSDLTARGAFNTVANERGTGRINRDLATGLAGIDNQRSAADIAYRGNILGLDEKGIGYDNQQASLSAQLSNYGLDMRRLSISEDQLNQSLQDGLYKIGLGGIMSLNNLMEAFGGANGQYAQVSDTILQQVLSLSNVPLPDQQQVLAAMRARRAQSTAAARSSSKG